MNLFLASALAEGTEEAAAAEEAVEATPTWAQELVEKFSEISGSTFVILGALVALAVVLLLACRTSKRWNAKAVAFAALSIALSYVLSCFRLYRMPQGGSVTPGSMLPIMLFSAAYGVGPGVVVGVVYGALQYLPGWPGPQAAQALGAVRGYRDRRRRSRPFRHAGGLYVLGYRLLGQPGV